MDRSQRPRFLDCIECYLSQVAEPDGELFSSSKIISKTFPAYTTEFFHDAGNAPPGSPSPIQNAMVKIGCAAGVLLLW